MSEKPKSYIKFSDGHEETILYREENANRIIVVSKSGIYMYQSIRSPFSSEAKFFKLKNDNLRFSSYLANCDFEEDPSISEIHIDDRASIEYTVFISGTCLTGNILVPRNLTDEKIRKEILNDVGVAISYAEKKE